MNRKLIFFAALNSIIILNSQQNIRRVIDVSADTSITLLIEQGQAFQNNEQFDEAIECYKKVLAINPDNSNAYFNLGNCYLSIGKGEEALIAFDTISHHLPAQYNAAYTCKTIGRLEEAIIRYKKILARYPDYDPAHLALGFAYIIQGNFERGWKQHTRYLKQSEKNGDTLRLLLSNNEIAYKVILLRPEGGLGDTINFIRYAERLKKMGATIIVTCQKPLIPLLSRCIYIDELIPFGNPLPAYDADATLMSLPAIFGDDDTTVPKNIPYLCADPALVEYWQKTLATDTNFKIGICWQADVHNDTSRLPIARRGCPLQHFEMLHDVPGISFYSLQKYEGVEQIASISPHFTLNHFDNLDKESGAFMDTAALMKNLDLIITIDSAVAHLAGALGCPVWLLLPYATDWRWMCNHTDSYWYPTMRIFKQQEPFDWEEIMAKVKKELMQIVPQF